MAPHIKNERARLLRQREQLLKLWEKADPNSAARFRSLEAALEVLSAPKDGIYQRFRTPKEAVRACLEHEGKWLQKQVIADKLFNGGFVMDPEFGRRLVVQSITKNIGRGHFIQDEAGNVGLPEWA